MNKKLFPHKPICAVTCTLGGKDEVAESGYIGRGDGEAAPGG